MPLLESCFVSVKHKIVVFSFDVSFGLTWRPALNLPAGLSILHFLVELNLNLPAGLSIDVSFILFTLI